MSCHDVSQRSEAPKKPPWWRRIGVRQREAVRTYLLKVKASAACSALAPAGHLINGAVLNAPTMSVICGVVVACVPPVQDFIFAADGDDCTASADDGDDDGPPLRFLADALARLGGAMIPSLMISLGASLARGPGAAVPGRVVATLAALRLVILPVLGGAAVLGLRSWGAYEPPDRMFVLVLLLMQAMPSALNLYTLAAVHNNHADELATMLFWQYLACVLTIPMSVAVFLAVV